MSPPVLLDIDLGEHADEPDELWALAHVANIACGGHAGTAESIASAISKCARYDTHVGAHPSYPDRPSFGRRAMNLEPSALRDSLADQCASLAAVARGLAVPVRFVKAHGALYHTAHTDPAVANAVVAGALAALGRDVAWLGLDHGALAAAARREGLEFLPEVFGDRATRADGTLVPRSEPGAVLSDHEAVARNLDAVLARPGVRAVCVHGDTPSSVEIARIVRTRLDARTR